MDGDGDKAEGTDEDQLGDGADDQEQGKHKRSRKSVSRLADEMLQDPVYTEMGGAKKRRGGDESSDLSEEESTSSGQESSKSDWEPGSQEEDEESEGSEDSDSEEPSGIVAEGVLTSNLKKEYAQWSFEVQESFNQDDLHLRRLLSLGPDHLYVADDLEDVDVLDRALRLLFANKFGSDNVGIRLSPHIKYNNLPAAVVAAIKAKYKTEETQLQEALRVMKEPRSQ